MPRTQKLYHRLDMLEAEIRSRLLPALRAAAEGKHTRVFDVAAYSLSPNCWPGWPETEALLALADEAKSLRGKLGDSAARAIGERLRAYCRRAMDGSDHNRLGTQRLAEQFLVELGERVDQR